ncbi:MAG: Do family serine endopeptidase [Henriciella sp.]|jgi:serine protease Do
MKSLRFSVPTMIAGLVGAGAMATLVWGTPRMGADTQPILVEAPAGAPLSFADLIEQVSPAVVSVNVISEQERPDLSEMERFFERFRQGPGAVPRDEEDEPETQEARSLGSGFFISEEGYVVTNNHVIANATQIQIVLEDGRELEAELVGTDAQTDLAVLKVSEQGTYPFVQFGSSAGLRRGDWVVALGNPFGLGGTATAGILSADGRDLGNSNPYTDFLQIDAAINRGNSGGPTFDLYGRVVGVNTAIFSPTGGSVGIGFAIPSDLAQEVTSTLIEKGRVSRGWLGVTIQDVTPDMAEARGLELAEGAIVADLVANSPAKKSGIRRGDIIIEVNGEKVTDATSTTRIVGRLAAGSQNRFVVLRDGDRKTISVTVGERPEDVNASFQGGDDVPEDEGVSAEAAPLGLYLRPMDDETRNALNLSGDEPGLVVDRVATDSPLRELGIQPGMVLLDANNVYLYEVADLVRAIEAALDQGRDKLLLSVHVGAGTRFVTVDIGGED